MIEKVWWTSPEQTLGSGNLDVYFFLFENHDVGLVIKSYIVHHSDVI